MPTEQEHLDNIVSQTTALEKTIDALLEAGIAVPENIKKEFQNQVQALHAGLQGINLRRLNHETTQRVVEGADNAIGALVGKNHALNNQEAAKPRDGFIPVPVDMAHDLMQSIDYFDIGEASVTDAFYKHLAVLTDLFKNHFRDNVADVSIGRMKKAALAVINPT